MPVPVPVRPPVRSMFGVDVECENCGWSVRGRYCSNCGHKPNEPATIGTLLYEHLVEERLNDLFAFVKALWFLVVCPVHFFEGLLIRHSLLPNDRFFLSGAWRKVSHKIQDVADPVRFVGVCYGILLLLRLSRIIPEEHGIADLLKDAVEPMHMPALATVLQSDLVKHEVDVIFVLVLVAVYAFSLSVILGERISTNDITRFFLYPNGILALVAGLLPAFLTDEATALLLLGVMAYLLILTYVVLPRLYHISRKRLLASQFGSLFLMMGAFMFLVFLAAMVSAMFGGTA